MSLDLQVTCLVFWLSLRWLLVQLCVSDYHCLIVLACWAIWFYDWLVVFAPIAHWSCTVIAAVGDLFEQFDCCPLNPFWIIGALFPKGFGKARIWSFCNWLLLLPPLLTDHAWSLLLSVCDLICGRRNLDKKMIEEFWFAGEQKAIGPQLVDNDFLISIRKSGTEYSVEGYTCIRLFGLESQVLILLYVVYWLTDFVHSLVLVVGWQYLLNCWLFVWWRFLWTFSSHCVQFNV